MTFLRAFDDGLALLALKALAALANPPMTHKSIEEDGHNTALHKNSNLCLPFFEIGESLSLSLFLSLSLSLSSFNCRAFHLTFFVFFLNYRFNYNSYIVTAVIIVII
jgi:hypothetical protein